MISFSLKCADGHSFDSWFQSSEAFEKLQATGMVSCAVCGSSNVQKSLMAPRVSTGISRADTGTGTDKNSKGALSQPAHPAEQALAEMRKKVEANSEYVGPKFAAEARKMHLGDAPERAIYGEAKMEDAKKLIEDGVPVLPLPFKPNRRTN
ncbi:DUF1178 family protein [Lentibacter sp.]|uniref:DUF1178 family protein n=1 Tax=Lentibacter sp. TaxID=2024994 RepID=UPI003F69ABE7